MHPPSNSDTSATPWSSPVDSAAFGTQTHEDRQDQCKAYPSGLKFAAIMVAICFSFTLVGLVSQARTALLVRLLTGKVIQDSNVIATAVPAMTRYFGTVSDIAWYTSI